MKNRPTVRPKTPVSAFPLEEGFFDEQFILEVDEAVHAALRHTDRPAEASPSADPGLAEMQETYVELARIHLRPVLRYLKAIHMGIASRDLCDLVRFVVGPLVDRTRSVGLVDHAEALRFFHRNLDRTIRTSKRKLTQEQRLSVSEAFLPVQAAFDLDFRGHAAAIVNLLGFFRTIRRNRRFDEEDLRKLFSIGIPSITMLRKTALAELSSLSGLPVEKVADLRTAARRFSVLSLI